MKIIGLIKLILIHNIYSTEGISKFVFTIAHLAEIIKNICNTTVLVYYLFTFISPLLAFTPEFPQGMFRTSENTVPH